LKESDKRFIINTIEKEMILKSENFNLFEIGDMTINDFELYVMKLINKRKKQSDGRT
jgi:hypothetical protein